MWKFFSAVLIAWCFVLPLSGCQRAGESVEEHAHDGHAHDHAHHHEHPETYGAAFAQIEKHHDAIRVAYTEGDPKDAHDALHEVGEFLELLPKLASKAGLSEEKSSEVKEAADLLFDAFGKLDAVMHGGAEVKYADLADQFEQNLGVLRAKLALVGEK